MAVQTTDADLDAFFAASKEAMTQEKFKSELTRLRDDYSDEIPGNDVNSTSPAPEGKVGWKVRSAWFLQIANLLYTAILDGLLNQDLEDRSNAFMQYLEDGKKKRTTKEEIDYANRLLDDVVSSLNI